MGWSNGVLELAGPGRVSPSLASPDLDGTGGRFVARDPPSWCGLQTSVCPLSHSQTSNVPTQSSKGDSALVSLPGAQLVCWIQTLLSFSRVDCLPKPQLVHLIPTWLILIHPLDLAVQ